MNKLAIFAAVLLLFFGAMLWYLASADWNGFIRSQIEIQGSKVTGQDVQVDKVDLKVTKGFGGIYGISIANPDEYTQPKAFYLGEVSLGIDVKSLTSSPIILDTITLDKVQAFVEFDKQGNNNLKDILDIINDNIPKSDAPEKDSSASKDTSSEPRIAIKKLTVANVALTLDLTEVNGKTLDVKIPSVDLNAIGGEEGLPASELGGVIANNLFSAIKKEAEKQYKKGLEDKAKNKLEKEANRFLDKLKKKNGDN